MAVYKTILIFLRGNENGMIYKLIQQVIEFIYGLCYDENHQVDVQRTLTTRKLVKIPRYLRDDKIKYHGIYCGFRTPKG